MKNILLYLVYGKDKRYIQETRFSLLTAWRYFKKTPQDCTMVVCTDQPESFRDCPVVVHDLDEKKLQTWAGPARYFHRAKNRVVAEVMDRFQKPVALIDTDTCFTKTPLTLFDRISPGKTVMHSNEGSLIKNHRGLWDLLHHVQIANLHGHNYAFGPKSAMWNSGVVGIHPADRPLLDQALALLDALYVETGIFNVEQFALGEVLKRQTRLATAHDAVIHYWGFSKPFFQARLTSFFQQYQDSDFETQAMASWTLKHHFPHHPFADRLKWAIKNRWHHFPSQLASICLAVKAGTTTGSSSYGRDVSGQGIWRDYAYIWLQQLIQSASSVQLKGLLGLADLSPIRDVEQLGLLPDHEVPRWQDLWKNLPKT